MGEVNCGLALSNSLQLLIFIQWLVRMSGDVHSAMSSVSAVIYFGDHVSSEAAPVVKDCRPHKSWPEHGEVKLERNI